MNQHRDLKIITVSDILHSFEELKDELVKEPHLINSFRFLKFYYYKEFKKQKDWESI
ncbi:hypothetical protein [Pontibacillus litoralis]|uniref:Uncharacterized protein n=1 Tax=Pontibacillus litoralis JSM 072002 TaxID=1385512 RepID=A0A0A5G3T0_9BACI|nr:hypothetical protein [Pontibacillus litoralis]KGX85798.1 hypothetical protein N784_08225 [Pontibacillus litoralis JSM 072002]